MANVRIDLTKIKASGVYTFEFDQSETIIVSQQTIKLVVGFSRTGPFNTAVFLQDTQTAKTVFGDIDTFLERSGCFFQRTILKGLETGPVFAVNLLNLNNEIPTDPMAVDNSDQVPYRSFSFDTGESNGVATNKLLSSYYNKEKFWFPNEKNLLATRNILDLDKAFSIVNLSQNKQTILIRKPEGLVGFDVTANEWYGQNNVPNFIYPYDLISDYFIEIIAVNGDFGASQYASLSIDPLFSAYFDANGLIKETLDDFLSLPEVTFSAKYIGCIIPDFTDKSNVNYYIQNLVNVSSNVTGLFCAVDEKLIDTLSFNEVKIDMNGHSLVSALSDDDFDTIDFLSYKETVKETLKYDVLSHQTEIPLDLPFEWKYQLDTSLGVVYADDGNGFLSITVDRTQDPLSDDYTTLINSIRIGETVIPMTDAPATDYYFYLVTGLSVTANTFTMVLDIDYITEWQGLGLDNAVTGGFQSGFINLMEQDSQFDNPVMTTKLLAYNKSVIYDDYTLGNLVDGDIFYKDVATVPTPFYISLIESTTTIGLNLKSFDTLDVIVYSDEARTTLSTISFTDITFEADKVAFEADFDKLNVVSLQNAINSEVQVTPTAEGNKFVITQTESAKLSVGDFLVALDGLHLTRVVEMATDPLNVLNVIVTTYEAVRVQFGKVDKILAMEDIISSYDLTYLSGFTMKDTHIPNGTDDRMNEILGVMQDTNIFDALTDKDLLQYRYIVDCFGGGLEPQCKGILAELAKKKGQAMALLNVPSMEQFTDSISPRFTDAPTPSNPLPLLNAKYIADGGNLSLNPPFKFGLASETTGGKYVGYFAPYITIRENSRNKQIPPAMYVANNFVRKFINGTPYAIVAGRKRGLIEDSEVVGLEYNFDVSQREYLEPFGINPIITKRGIGIEIYANQTAFQNISSAFNSLHVRDLLISLEEGIEQIAENFVFEFNDSSIRLEIETTVKTFMEDVKANGGLLDFKVIMNSTNNPGAIIDQNFGILDVVIEPPKGIQKFINRITVTKTGAIAQGGFTIQ